MAAKDSLLDGVAPRPGLIDVLKTFSPVGFLSFGGTPANMSMFMNVLVVEKKWIGQAQYAELLGMVQSLPGASAIQILLCSVTVATASPLCGVMASLFFMTPAAVAMAIIGTNIGHNASLMTKYQAELQPLEGTIGCVAIALVARGTLELGQKLVTDKFTKCLWLATCMACFGSAALPSINADITLFCIVFSAVSALVYYPPKAQAEGDVAVEAPSTNVGISRVAGHVLFWSGWLLLAIFFIWPFFGEIPPVVGMIAPYYKVGCLVFGGGPVVLPMLLLQLLANHAITTANFSMGIAVVQLMPGPMFNISSFCGALEGGLLGALVCWSAMSIPGLIMALGALPFYAKLRGEDHIQRALKGVNAAAAGLMAAALLLLWKTIVGTSSVRVCGCLFFIGMDQIFSVKAYWLVFTGLAIGVSCSCAGFQV